MNRILYVIATLDAAGAERQMVQLVTRLDRGTFQPQVCCLTRGGPLEAVLKAADVPTQILEKRGKFDRRVFRRLRTILREFEPHIVHTWLPTANTIGRLAALRGRRPLLVASERAADVWKGRLRRWVDRRLAQRTDLILCNAQAVRRFLLERIGLPGDRIQVIRNGLDIESFDRCAGQEPSDGLPPAARGPVIGTVARLEPQKDVPGLVEAFARLPDRMSDARLWIVGEGPERLRIESQIARHGLAERAWLAGRRDDVPALLRRMELFVLPSLWEGLPNAVLEAMAARRPVVATRVDGTPEAVADGETGLLVPPRDTGALTAAMARLLDDPDLRARYGAAGRQRVETAFGIERMVKETCDAYLSLPGGDAS